MHAHVRDLGYALFGSQVCAYTGPLKCMHHFCALGETQTRNTCTARIACSGCEMTNFDHDSRMAFPNPSSVLPARTSSSNHLCPYTSLCDLLGQIDAASIHHFACLWQHQPTISHVFPRVATTRHAALCTCNGATRHKSSNMCFVYKSNVHA